MLGGLGHVNTVDFPKQNPTSPPHVGPSTPDSTGACTHPTNTFREAVLSLILYEDCLFAISPLFDTFSCATTITLHIFRLSRTIVHSWRCGNRRNGHGLAGNGF